MRLSESLAQKGFSLADTEPEDFSIYLRIKKICYAGYVDRYYGGWIDEVQEKMNAATFGVMMKQSCFQKILLHGETVGFLAYHEMPDKIDGLSIHMMPEAQSQGMGSFYLDQIVALSQKQGKPAFLKVFRSNPAQKLYARHGFVVYDETATHFLMRYGPENKA